MDTRTTASTDSRSTIQKAQGIAMAKASRRLGLSRSSQVVVLARWITDTVMIHSMTFIIIGIGTRSVDWVGHILKWGLKFFIWREFTPGQSLSDALRIACKKWTSMIDYFLGVSLLRGEQNVKQWETKSTQPWFSKGEWHSIYRLTQSKRESVWLFKHTSMKYWSFLVSSQASILQTLEAAEKAQVDKSEEQSGQRGLLSHLIHDGIKLQEKQYVHF